MDFKERMALREQASLPYWWEKTRTLDIPQPKTVYTPYKEETLRRTLDGGALDIAPLLDAAEEVGGYPVFLRTDQMSGKHSWEDTCHVESAGVMRGHVLALLEENYMLDMGGEALPGGLAVREFLDLDWSFRAFHGRMPVATEVRTFLRDGTIECIHPYWPPQAIQDWVGPVYHTDLAVDASPYMPKRDIPEDWRDILARQNARIVRDIDVIRACVQKVAAVMDGWWSCDMVLGRDGTWYLIDMAPGAASYHWPSCEHKPADQS